MNAAVGDRPFLGVELKLARGRLHAETLARSVTEWIQRCPLAARAEYTLDRLGYRLILEPFAEAPLCEHWALLIGDCVHNLRSALDNLCFSLARAHRDPPADPSGIYFPVFDDPQRFQRDAVRTLRQLPPRAAALVERWQPFHRGDRALINRDALFLLKELSNQDKHRLPQVVLMSIGQRDHNVGLQFHSDVDATAFVDGPPRVEINGGPISPGMSLIEVVGNRPIREMLGRVTVEAVPAIKTVVALEGAIPTTAALVDHAWQIFDSFRAL